MRIVVGSPEEAINWLIHEPNQDTPKWKRAWNACRDVIDGRIRSEDARKAVELVAARG